MRLIVRFRPQDFIRPIGALEYSKDHDHESHARRGNSVIQTLGLSQTLKKVETQPLAPINEAAEGNGNTARHARVGFPRKTLSIQTMAFAQDRPESPAFANSPQRTEPLVQTGSQVADDVVEPVTLLERDLVSETSGIAQDFPNAGVEFAPLEVSEAAHTVEETNSRTDETTTEPAPPGVSAVAAGSEHVTDFERVTSPAIDPTIPQKTQAEPSPQAISKIAEGNGHGPHLEPPIPPAQNSAVQAVDFAHSSQRTETDLPPRAIDRVADCNGKTPAQLSALPSSESQGAGKVAERIENLNPLEQIPVEEVDVDPLSKIVFYTDPRGVAADRFRFLRMRIRELSDARKLKSLLVTSALSLDGKSTVSLNLATALAERGQSRVLLLEADLYHPTLAQRLGLESAQGLAECLSSGLAPLSVVRRIEPLGWYFLPAGRQLADPSDLLHGDGFAGIMQALSPHFKWIVIDSPPVVPVADALALARHADASLLVVRAGQTPSDAVEAALESLGPKHVMGVILNGVEGLDRLYSKYNKYYGPVAAPAKRP